MTSTAPSSSAPVASVATSKVMDYASYIPKQIVAEDSMSNSARDSYWTAIYRKVNVSTEEARKSVRFALYTYHAINGTSPHGDYSTTIVTSTGTSFVASVVILIVGKFSVRKFFRSNMSESVEYFKGSSVLSLDQRFVTKMASLGIAAEDAWVGADWLSNCPELTPKQQSWQNALLIHNLEKARNARNNKTTEEMQSEQMSALGAAGTTDPTARANDKW